MNSEEEEDTADTTTIRLPGMRSRLEITRITWVREIPISTPKPLYETAPQSSMNSYHFSAAHPLPSFNYYRSRAFSDPSSFSSLLPSAISYPNDLSAPTTTISTHHESYNDIPIGVAHGRVARGHSLSLSAFNGSSLDHTHLHQLTAPLTCVHTDTDSVTRPTFSFTAHPQPPSPPNSSSSLHSPTHVLAGPSQTLLDILNGSSANTQLQTSIPVPPLPAGSGLCPAQDPPVFKPKPIGSINTSYPIGHRRFSDSASDGLPAAASEEGEQAPPWPPVLAPLSC
jgi:hypothetical protein